MPGSQLHEQGESDGPTFKLLFADNQTKTLKWWEKIFWRFADDKNIVNSLIIFKQIFSDMF